VTDTKGCAGGSGSPPFAKEAKDGAPAVLVALTKKESGPATFHMD
jgi:hypothetical protein